jgi:hypothetical protein
MHIAGFTVMHLRHWHLGDNGRIFKVELTLALAFSWLWLHPAFSSVMP